MAFFPVFCKLEFSFGFGCAYIDIIVFYYCDTFFVRGHIPGAVMLAAAPGAAVFLGGVLCLTICRWQEQTLLRGGRTSRIWLCVFPVMVLWFVWADANLSQRLSEGLRTLLIFGAMWLFLKIARVRLAAPSLGMPAVPSSLNR